MVLVIVVILVCVITSLCAVFFINNKNDEKAPINHLINAINNRDVSEIPKAFHEYCSLSVEQNISEEEFENYIMVFQKILVVIFKSHTKLLI